MVAPKKPKKTTTAKKKTTTVKKGGRKPDYQDPAIIEKILANKRMGMSDGFAFRAAGIGRETYARWKRKLDDPKCPLQVIALFKELEIADAQGQQQALEYVWREATTNWKAAFKLLERRWPDDFAPPQKDEVDKESPVQVVVNLPDNQRYNPDTSDE